MNQANDPQAFTNFEYEGWERAAEEYARSFAELTAQTNDLMLEQVRVKEGDRLIDLACGPGDLARRAAACGVHVVAVDFSPSMIAVARSRGEDGIVFVHENVERMASIGDESFECAVMNFGILHLAQPEVALREVFRVLKLGGVFAFSTWKRPDEAKGFRVVLDAIAEHGSQTVSLPHGPNFFFYSEPEECQRALERAGFRTLGVHFPPDMNWSLPSRSALYWAFANGSARTGGLLRAQAPQVARKIQEAVAAVASQYEEADGTITVPMPALVAVGQRPRR